MNTFALIGAAGYIAPRHYQAIRDTGHKLVAALDKHDSVGILDSYFPDASFFTEFERFDRFVDKSRRSGRTIDYVTICSPNYLHDAHVRFALRSGADAICEKPLVLNPWNIDGLKQIERETGRKVNTILQLRLHPRIIELRDKVIAAGLGKSFDVDLTYITSRGRWYMTSWKGEEHKSGGIATNIGVHFFDMLYFVFGRVKRIVLHHSSPQTIAGHLEMERANVRWFLSIDENTLPDAVRSAGQRTYRSILVDGEELEFSGGFTDLHTQSYEKILVGEGFGLEENRSCIETVSALRTQDAIGLVGEYHPLISKIAA